jgi:hypothetical protein
MASLTLEKFRATCQSAGVPMSSVAQVVGVKPTSLSSALRDVMNLGGEKEARLMTVALRLSELQVALFPLQLPDNPEALKILVNGLESGRVSLDGIREFVSKLLDQ